MKTFYFLIKLLSLSLILSNTYGQKHTCSHDSKKSYNIPSDYNETFESKYGKRNLQSSRNIKPFRVTFDSSQLKNKTNGEGMTNDKSKYIIQIMKTAQIFLGNFIQVVPRNQPITSSYGWTSCGQQQYPPSLYKNGIGIPNSDMHILVSYQNDTTSSNVAFANLCELDPGPTITNIVFNIASMDMSTDNQKFQDNVSIVLHELTHTLGFSNDTVRYWIDPDTGKPYGSNSTKVLTQTTLWGIDGVNKLSSKNVVRVAQNHFACASIDGMFMENQGGNGSKGLHWEKDLVRNEYMTASQDSKVFVISEFTAALLRDTGFYASISDNLTGKLYWGKNKGCDFFQNTCNSKLTTYPEFPVQFAGKQHCDFYGKGIGNVQSVGGLYSQCPTAVTMDDKYCQDPLFKPNELYRQNTGVNSYCFESTSVKNTEKVDSTYAQRCNKIKCSEDFSTITVYLWAEESITCTIPGQVIDLSKVAKTTIGNFTCPIDFQMICNFPSTCPQQCSQNGICVNGYCMCLDGYVGEDCSLSCAYPNILEENKCVAICSGLNYKNPDNTCKPKCPQGYYKDQPTKTCILCHSNCSNCTGPLSTQCSSCNLGYLQKGNTCDSFPCDPTCGTCFGLGSNQCTSCQPGYILSGSTCLPIECHPSCKSCSSPNNANSCTDCFAESYLNAYKQCVYCTLPCKDCKSENQCTSCINDEYIIDSVKQVCKLKCHNTCTLCFQANDNTKCDSCIDGYYIDRTTCKICNSPCSKCTQSPTKCIECAANYQINNQNECIPQCDQSCNTCSKPLDKNSCITCNKGYTMVNSLCQQCTYPCTECQTSQTNCTKCAPSHVLRDNVCEPICDDSCLTCFKSIDPNSCTSCNPGFYLSVNNKEVQGSCKQCQSFCQTCKDGQTCQECIQGYLLQKDGSCSPICDTSCLTCSKPNDRNSCLSCSAPLVLQDRSCKQCQSFCQTCKDGQTCQECIQGYLLQKDGSCSPICDASCLTCSKPNDKNSCLSCSAPLVLQNSQCQQCDDGFYFDNGSCSKCSNNCKSCSNKLKCGICMDGYILDSTFNCIKSNTCHFTCQNCIGDLYYQCTFCPHNRLLVKIDESLSYGICQCPEDTTDSNEPECEQSKVQQYLKQTIIGSFAGSAFKSILISAGLFNPLLALSYFQLSQGISYLNLINARQSVGFDEVLRVISSSNFDFKQFKSPSKSNNNKRILPDQSSNIDLINDYQININPKIALNNKNYNFLENSQTNLWIQGFAWFISFSTYLINKYVQIKCSFIKNIQKYTVISLPLLTFAVCSQEMWLCIFYQFGLYSNGISDVEQFVCSLFGIFYMIAVLCYLFYYLEYKKCLNTRQSIKPLQIIDVNSTQSLQIVSDTNLEDQKKFYFLNLYVKQDSFATRNIIQIVVLLKMIISIAASCIYQNAYTQIIIYILSYFAFCVYIAVFRPLQQFKHNVILLLINFIITLLSIIYATSLSPQNDTKQSKTLSLVMLSIIITTYVVLITFWVLILLYIIYNQLRKCTSKDLVTSDQPKKLPQSQIPQLKDEQASQLNVNDNTQIQFGPKSGQFSQNQLQSDKRINVLYSARVL